METVILKTMNIVIDGRQRSHTDSCSGAGAYHPSDPCRVQYWREVSGILCHKAGTETIVISSCASDKSWSHVSMSSLFSLGPLL